MDENSLDGLTTHCQCSDETDFVVFYETCKLLVFWLNLCVSLYLAMKRIQKWYKKNYNVSLDLEPFGILYEPECEEPEEDEQPKEEERWELPHPTVVYDTIAETALYWVEVLSTVTARLCDLPYPIEPVDRRKKDLRAFRNLDPPEAEDDCWVRVDRERYCCHSKNPIKTGKTVPTFYQCLIKKRLSRTEYQN